MQGNESPYKKGTHEEAVHNAASAQGVGHVLIGLSLFCEDSANVCKANGYDKNSKVYVQASRDLEALAKKYSIAKFF
jgi:hypothetical protein